MFCATLYILTLKFHTVFPCRCLAAIKDEETSQFMKSSYEELIAAKKENVALQLEGAYRSRINEAYQQVSHHHIRGC